MEVDKQTDGVEWVLVTLFVISMLLVVAAAVREIRRARSGDSGGDPDPRHGRTEDPER
jgi:hypothetical protein